MQMGAEVFNNCEVIDEVWFVPCGDREDKQLRTVGEHRLKMMKIALEEFYQGDPTFKVFDLEIVNGKSIPTYYLMLRLEKLYKSHDFHFVIGTDLLPDLIRWDGGQEFVDNVKFIIYPRAGYQMPEKVPPQCRVLKKEEVVYSQLSSTVLRQRIAETKLEHKKLGLVGITPLGVIKYIKE